MLIRLFLTKIKKLVLSLRVSILAIFIILFLCAILSLITASYVNFSTSITYSARKRMSEAAFYIFNNIFSEFEHAKTEATMGANLIERKVVDVNNKPQMIEFLLHTMLRERESFPSIHSVYWADETGDLSLAASESDDKKELTLYILKHNDPTSTLFITTQEIDGKIKGTTINKSHFDQRVRPWYLKAKYTGNEITTIPYHYTFFTKPFWGITIGSPIFIDGKFLGVFGTNIRLDFLRKLLEKIKISEHSIIFIATEDGKLISLPHYVQFMNPQLANMNDIPDQALITSFKIYKRHQQAEFIFNANNQKYLAAYKKITGFVPQTWYLGILVPEEDFIGVLKRNNIITVVIGLFILLLGIVVFSLLITRAVKSLKFLVRETEKIKHFDLGDDIHIESHIKEVIYLRDALNSMKTGLRSFQKYVPADLVRQLIETGINAQVGGDKKQLVIFFSDVKNFTTISETLDPNQLMIYTCEYFDELSKIIIRYHGTIDKYIGDAIMAFWGAPLPHPDPCYQAAKAALACQKQLILLNNKWQTQGIPAFITRIGIHVGDAIVGNLGSSERINYTAIGDNINIASRLEGANKIYHSSIIVSEPVYQNIKDRFLLRMVDYVLLKGKEKAIYIYELLGENNNILPFDLEAYEKLFKQGFAEYQQKRWDNAISYFQQCIKVYPDDHAAILFINRCEQFKVNPPRKEWYGAWQFSEK